MARHSLGKEAQCLKFSINSRSYTILSQIKSKAGPCFSDSSQAIPILLLSPAASTATTSSSSNTPPAATPHQKIPAGRSSLPWLRTQVSAIEWSMGFCCWYLRIEEITRVLYSTAPFLSPKNLWLNCKLTFFFSLLLHRPFYSLPTRNLQGHMSHCHSRDETRNTCHPPSRNSSSIHIPQHQSSQSSSFHLTWLMHSQ